MKRRSSSTTVAEPGAIARNIVSDLRKLRNERNIEGQRRYGIRSALEQLGVAAPVLRAAAKPYRRNHDLALALWEYRILEARNVAVLVDDPAKVTAAQMEEWVREFDNWATVDACCCHLFDRTSHAEKKACVWSRRRAEFVKRAGFVLMAGMAVHRKELADDVFLAFLPVTEREAYDERNFVKKAVNWALRQIGKRNDTLRDAAIECAERILAQDTPSARWIARDALRELRRSG